MINAVLARHQQQQQQQRQRQRQGQGQQRCQHHETAEHELDEHQHALQYPLPVFGFLYAPASSVRVQHSTQEGGKPSPMRGDDDSFQPNRSNGSSKAVRQKGPPRQSEEVGTESNQAHPLEDTDEGTFRPSLQVRQSYKQALTLACCS